MEDREDNSSRTPRVSPLPTLKPCPFCSGPARLIIEGVGACHVECQECCATVNDGSDDLAIAAWNRRARNAHDDLIAALTKAADQFEFYEREHRYRAREVAGTVEESTRTLKARANGDFARMCRAALAKAEMEAT